jgi:hypothetical protein
MPGKRFFFSSDGFGERTMAHVGSGEDPLALSLSLAPDLSRCKHREVAGDADDGLARTAAWTVGGGARHGDGHFRLGLNGLDIEPAAAFLI